jgi:hypothetical protein|tara:strand:+ start:1044 stop:1187 length:144 start_codon:yes stop_codon:yes gene_type:complete
VGGGVSTDVLEGIDDVLQQSKIKNAALTYLSQKVNPGNIDALQKVLE